MNIQIFQNDPIPIEILLNAIIRAMNAGSIKHSTYNILARTHLLRFLLPVILRGTLFLCYLCPIIFNSFKNNDSAFPAQYQETRESVDRTGLIFLPKFP